MALHKTMEGDPWTVADRQRDEGVEVDAHARSNASNSRRNTLIVAALVAFIVFWAIANFAVEGAGFVLLVPDKLLASEEAASALARFFAALVLVLFFTEAEGWRLRWVAAGLVILGLGHLTFGYIEPMIQDDPPELNESLYESLVTRTAASALFVIGLLPRRAPRRSIQVAMIVLATAPIVGYLLVFEILEGESWMPPLTRVDSPREAVELGMSFGSGWLTPWHWALSTLPLGLAVAAAVGAFRQNRHGLLRSWVLFAMVLLAGSLLHEHLWPTAYGLGVLSSADLLRLAFALVVAVGGIVELRRIASERAKLLAAERELAALRADFSAMLAHELGGPIIAIRVLKKMLDAEGADPEVREYATAAIESEVETLSTLVADVRVAAAVEQDGFKVEARPLPMMKLLLEAEAYANTLASEHPIKTTFSGDLGASPWVWADPERVGQVLRNLISNAVKYSPEGTLIEIRTSCKAGRAWIEVADHGPGIHPDDLDRIFEKFDRGCDRRERKPVGAGLGLYLSRQIMRSHGSDLTVRSTPGAGSVFGFDLKVAQ